MKGRNIALAIILLALLALTPFAFRYKAVQDAGDKFCQSKNYTEMTDYKDTADSWFEQDIKIECDGKVLHQYSCHIRKRCSEYDKFEDCSDEKITILCYNRYSNPEKPSKTPKHLKKHKST